ncbi:MAG: AAA family ATPase [Chitinophagaceae bacterium]
MELAYIRINNYKGLSGIDLNLSNQFRFSFQEKENSIEVRLTENYIRGFFAENVTNFTGIIGQNGTGKTSVLRYIVQYFGHGNNEIDEKSIAVFYNRKKFYYYAPAGIKLKKPGTEYYAEKMEDLDDFKRSVLLIFASSHFDPTSVFSVDSLKEQLGDSVNLSTNYLLSRDIQKRRTFKDSSRETLPYKDHVNAFAAQEFIRIVKLLRWITTKQDRNPFPAELPPYINLNLYYNEDSPNREKFQILIKELESYFKMRKSRRDQFLINAFTAGVFHLADEGSLSLNRGPGDYITETIDRIIEFIGTQKNRKDEILLSKIMAIIADLRRTDLWRATSSKLVDLNRFIKQLSVYLDKHDGKVNANGTSISIKLSRSTIKSLISLIDSFYAADKVGDYAEFYFSHQPFGESSLSSGEYSLLSLFGRINNFRFDSGKRNMLFLVDEAELALHPAWQRRFIDVFLEFIAEKFGRNSVQVIFTSHSPFILSDLPPHCVVLLRKENKETVAVDSLTQHKETFGANVHELFTDSFFIEDGLMGEFARKKIEQLINGIKEEKSISLEAYESTYKKRVDILGEQFLKTKISELIAAKADLDTVDQIIEQRTNELEILNQIRKEKRDDQNRES